MKKGITIALAAALLSMSVIPSVSSISNVTASANSASHSWYGISATGALVTNGDCPLEVQNEKLVFDLQEFPKSDYQSGEEFLAYTGKVTANYTFYNPSENIVNATLVFPFGKYPDYYSEYEAKQDGLKDADKYTVTVNGQAVDSTLRHTWKKYHDFDAEEDMALLLDDYIEDKFYSLDMPVTRYSYRITGVPDDISSCYASFPINYDSSVTRVMHVSLGTLYKDGEKSYIRTHINKEEGIELFVFGNAFASFPEWVLSEDYKLEQKISGEMLLEAETKMTFEEYVFSEYEDGAISKVDWYNACILAMNDQLNDDYSGLIRRGELDPYRDLMRWYQYDIEVTPKSTIVNTVTAPIYPYINADYEPAIYGYEYLLSPAQTWSKFGTLEIEINTPYYLIDDENGFEKTEKGYSLSLEGLPKGELNFRLSSEEEPKRNVDFFKSCGYLILYLIMIPEGLIDYAVESVGCTSAIIGTVGVYSSILISAVVLFFKKRK